MRLNFNMVYRNKKMVMLLWKSVHLNSRLLLWLKLWLNRLHLVTVCGASTPLPKMLLDWKVHQITTLTISALKQFIQVVRWCSGVIGCIAASQFQGWYWATHCLGGVSVYVLPVSMWVSNIYYVMGCLKQLSS